VSLSQSQQFQATVTGTSNKSVTWFANGVAGGNASVGTVSLRGVYTAPSTMPSPPTITVTASSITDSPAAGSALGTLKCGIGIGISPTSATVSRRSGQATTAMRTGARAS